MAGGKRQGSIKRPAFLLLLIALISVCAVAWGIYGPDIKETFVPYETAEPVSQEAVSNTGLMEVYFPQVGRADCALILCDGKAMLIDAGTGETAEDVLEYIRGKGVEKLDVVIATHPHEDHIGGMDDVLNSFPVGQFYTTYAPHTTKAYQLMLEAVENNAIAAAVPEPMHSFELGGAVCTFLTPLREDYKNLNDTSLVLKVSFASRVILFTGDAESVAEKDMVFFYGESGELKSDVLKVGHHGSNTSTSEGFLELVSPEYAVVATTLDVPVHENVAQRLAEAGVKVYVTDNGPIVCRILGGNIEIEEDK